MYSMLMYFRSTNIILKYIALCDLPYNLVGTQLIKETSGQTDINVVEYGIHQTNLVNSQQE